MARSWMKGLGLAAMAITLTAAGIVGYRSPLGPPSAPDVRKMDRHALSAKGYSPSLRRAFDHLGFLLDLKALDPAAPQYADQVTALITTYSARLPMTEGFYLESCYASLSFDDSLNTCERLLYQGLNQLTTSWRIPVVMGMISAMTYRELDKAASFLNLALSKPHLPADLAGFPRVESDEPERLAVRIGSFVSLAAKADMTIEKYRRTLKHALANREREPHGSADPGSQEHTEAF